MDTDTAKDATISPFIFQLFFKQHTSQVAATQRRAEHAGIDSDGDEVQVILLLVSNAYPVNIVDHCINVVRQLMTLHISSTVSAGEQVTLSLSRTCMTAQESSTP